jgi:hypothetical protein
MLDPSRPLELNRAERPANVRDETESERFDRNLTDLLGELRVALPGVQVLFAFLLVAPFNQRFGAISSFERAVYLVTLLLTLLAAILLVGPTIIHRLHFHQGEKGYVVRTANRLMIAGLWMFATAMTCAVFLITHYLFGTATSVVTTLAVLAAFALIWFVLPMQGRMARRGRPGETGAD